MSKKYQPSERKGVSERERKRKREEAHGGRLGEPYDLPVPSGNVGFHSEI